MTTTIVNRFCPNCGIETVPGGSFCGGCGCALSKTLLTTGRGSPGSAKSDVATTCQHPALLVDDAEHGFRMKGREKFIALVLAVLIVAGLAGLVITRHHSSPSQANPSTASANVATAGVPCSQNPACSGSGSTSTGPTSAQLQQAYQQGYFYGQHFPSTFNPSGITVYCRGGAGRFSDPQLSAQYEDGCGAGYGGSGSSGYGGGGSSTNDYGGIAGNQAPSPTAPDVQPYNGG